jgi:hypothetical protein
MVAIILILAVLALIAVAAGIGSRRKADERAGVARERAHIADDLAGREHKAAIR